jgi:membrane fusion protein, multidrug efflux system
VTLGGQSEGFRVVASGLRPGERIVVSGLQRLHPGDEVKANLVLMSGENTVAAR